MFYRIKENKLYDYADYQYAVDCLEVNFITQQQLDNDKLLVVVSNGALIPNPNYEEERAEVERERISHLRCTKRVLALILQELGVSYSRLKELIDNNPQAQLEWDLCVELERSNPLLDLVGAELGLTPTDIDNIFRYANGEIPNIEREVTNE